MIGGTEEEKTAPMDVQEDSTVTPIEDHDPPRVAWDSRQESAEATLKPDRCEGGRHCPCRFCTSTSTAHDPPPSALDAGPREPRLQQAGGVPGLFP